MWTDIRIHILLKLNCKNNDFSWTISLSFIGWTKRLPRLHTCSIIISAWFKREYFFIMREKNTCFTFKHTWSICLNMVLKYSGMSIWTCPLNSWKRSLDYWVKLNSVTVFSPLPINVTTPLSFQWHFLYWSHEWQWKHHQVIYYQWAHRIITVFLSSLSVALSVYWELYLSLRL